MKELQKKRAMAVRGRNANDKRNTPVKVTKSIAASPEKEKHLEEHSERNYELIGIVLAALGIICLCGIVGLNVGFVGLKVAKFLQYFFGIGAMPAGAVFVGLGGYYIMKHRKLVWNTRIIGGIMFYVCGLGMYHHWVIKEGAEILPESLLDGGGLLGGIITLILHKIVGLDGTPVLLGAGLLGSVLVITTWSLAKGILTTKEKAEQGAQAAKKATAAAYDKTIEVSVKAKEQVQEYVQEHVQEYVQEQVQNVGEKLQKFQKRDFLSRYEEDSAFLNNEQSTDITPAGVLLQKDEKTIMPKAAHGAGIVGMVGSVGAAVTAGAAVAQASVISISTKEAIVTESINHVEATGNHLVDSNPVAANFFGGEFASDVEPTEQLPSLATQLGVSEDELHPVKAEDEPPKTDNNVTEEQHQQDTKFFEDIVALDGNEPHEVDIESGEVLDSAKQDDQLQQDDVMSEEIDWNSFQLQPLENLQPTVDDSEQYEPSEQAQAPMANIDAHTTDNVPYEQTKTETPNMAMPQEEDIPYEQLEPIVETEALIEDIPQKYDGGDADIGMDVPIEEDNAAQSYDNDVDIVNNLESIEPIDDISIKNDEHDNYDGTVIDNELDSIDTINCMTVDEDVNVKTNEHNNDEQDNVVQAGDSLVEAASEAEQPATSDIEAPPPPPYILPSLHLLSKKEKVMSESLNQEIAENAKILGETLTNFKVKASILNACHGPAVTRYEVKPAPGVKVSKITGLADDIALNMAATAVRIEQIPGKAAIGIEVPNKELESVQLREVLENPAFEAAKSRLTVGLGKDISGQAIFADLAKMPHLLVAGATGSGKSVCINTLITSILFKAKPNEVKFILIDPKMVELSVYNDIPHLMVPVVTDAKKAASVLNWAVQEMEKRYGLIAQVGVRNMEGYNKQFETEPEKKLPSIVIIIDELADLMMVAPHDVEDAICRIAQKARAAGIYLVLATQRPSVNVITGVIKANIPSRISFAVTSQIDSRTILDAAGAEKLLGKGDMLFKPQEANKPTRIQGAFVSDKEVELLVEYIKSQGHKAEANQEIIDFTNRAAEADAEEEAETEKPAKAKIDTLLRSAVELVMSSNNASASSFQRRYHIGYSRAGRLLDTMEQLGIVGPPQGSKPREILVTEAQAFEIMDNYESQ